MLCYHLDDTIETTRLIKFFVMIMIIIMIMDITILIVIIQVGREYTNIKYSSELAGGADHMRTPLGRFSL